MNVVNSLWAEKFRPKTIDDTILPDSIKDIAKGIVSSGNVPTMLFTGGAGTGKTTLARAIANELNADLMFINASKEGNVDTIRTKMQRFASTVSFTNSKKITVLDEADGLTIAAQQALRGFVEEFSSNHSIIFTCNFANKIIEPIHSRCKVINFKFTKEDRVPLSTKFVKRLFAMLDSEGVEYDKKAVMELVKMKFPDFRSVINELQGYSASGRIDAGILLDLSEDAFKELMVILKTRKYSDAMKWVASHTDIEPTTLYQRFYDTAKGYLTPKSLAPLILYLGDYVDKSSRSTNPEITLMAFLTEVMGDSAIEFV